MPLPAKPVTVSGAFMEGVGDLLRALAPMAGRDELPNEVLAAADKIRVAVRDMGGPDFGPMVPRTARPW